MKRLFTSAPVNGAISILLLLGTALTANATLIFQIDTYTTDELSFTLSGTFDADTTGSSGNAGYLAVKNDWSNNFRVHTEMFSSTPTITSTILIGGLTPRVAVQNTTGPVYTWRDNIYFYNPLGSNNAILAGTTVSGSVTLSGIGAFDPTDAVTLELVSGLSVNDTFTYDWARLEARAQIASASVPEPITLALMGFGLTGVGFSRRKRV